jgi:hypothetical protein
VELNRTRDSWSGKFVAQDGANARGAKLFLRRSFSRPLKELSRAANGRLFYRAGLSAPPLEML